MRKNTIIGLTMLFIMAGGALSLTGCNTVAGAGKDVSAGGEAIHDSARDVQNKM